MCTYILTLHRSCSHKQYQNTFKCVSARGSVLNRSLGSLTLDQTIHLPDALPLEMPDPMCNQITRVATRPVEGQCRACMRKERETRAREKGEFCSLWVMMLMLMMSISAFWELMVMRTEKLTVVAI